jgi:hypothetical protein
MIPAEKTIVVAHALLETQQAHALGAIAKIIIIADAQMQDVGQMTGMGDRVDLEMGNAKAAITANLTQKSSLMEIIIVKK